MQRLIFINRYFAPDHSATSQMVSQLAFHLAASGRDVHVLTSRQRYDDPSVRLPPHDSINGVYIHRLAGSQFGRARLASRAIDYLSFYAAARRRLLKMATPNDILITMTDPPLLSIIGAQINRRTGARLINWLQDVYPEIASHLGVPLMGGAFGDRLATKRNASLRAADANVVVGRCMAERVGAMGLDNLYVIPNWCDDEKVTPVDRTDNDLRTAWDLRGKFVVGYSGNLGRPHEIETLLGGAERLRYDAKTVFLFIGGGFRHTELAARVQQANLHDKFKFVPYQAEDQLKFSLSVPDVHWISLKPELDGLIVPSKVYGVAAAGRPILSVTSRLGEVARLVEEHNCGLVIEPGNCDGFAKAIQYLANDPQTAKAMGNRARAMIDTDYSRAHAFARWEKVIDAVEQNAIPRLEAPPPLYLPLPGERADA